MILSSKGSGSVGGPTYTGFTLWPKIIASQITIPDDHVMPVHEIEIADGGEIVIGDGAELLVL